MAEKNTPGYNSFAKAQTRELSRWNHELITRLRFPKRNAYLIAFHSCVVFIAWYDIVDSIMLSITHYDFVSPALENLMRLF